MLRLKRNLATKNENRNFILIAIQLFKLYQIIIIICTSLIGIVHANENTSKYKYSVMKAFEIISTY